MNCQNCNSQHDEKANFCGMCGFSLKEVIVASEEVAAASEIVGRIEPARVADLIQALGLLIEQLVNRKKLKNEDLRFLALIFKGAADLAYQGVTESKPKQ